MKHIVPCRRPSIPQRLLLTLPGEVVKYNPVIDDAELVVNEGIC